MKKIAYQSIESLAIELHLPQRYLRQLAEQKKIPFLIVGGRRRFNLIAVKAVLDRLAEVEVSHEAR
jgi:excisionase family DNA binding protein